MKNFKLLTCVICLVIFSSAVAWAMNEDGKTPVVTVSVKASASAAAPQKDDSKTPAVIVSAPPPSAPPPPSILVGDSKAASTFVPKTKRFIPAPKPDEVRAGITKWDYTEELPYSADHIASIAFTDSHKVLWTGIWRVTIMPAPADKPTVVPIAPLLIRDNPPTELGTPPWDAVIYCNYRVASVLQSPYTNQNAYIQISATKAGCKVEPNTDGTPGFTYEE